VVVEAGRRWQQWEWMQVDGGDSGSGSRYKVGKLEVEAGRRWQQWEWRQVDDATVEVEAGKN
jgi:hypothetical protein